mmetsp:Transcript_11243/g.19700  ORF Transcript_11243/g.19700 Transcript_11243/m.19700 type:complete len:213 (+) Transcript_11243:542-1180(+)
MGLVTPVHLLPETHQKGLQILCCHGQKPLLTHNAIPELIPIQFLGPARLHHPGDALQGQRYLALWLGSGGWEVGQTQVHHIGSMSSLPHPGIHRGLLGLNHGGEEGVVDPRLHHTFHEGPPVIVLDPAVPSFSWEGDFFGEGLLQEVAHGVIVRICEEVRELVAGHGKLLGVVHEPSPKALDLFRGGDRTEGDLSKAEVVEGAVGDAAHQGT